MAPTLEVPVLFNFEPLFILGTHLLLPKKFDQFLTKRKFFNEAK